MRRASHRRAPRHRGLRVARLLLWAPPGGVRPARAARATEDEAGPELRHRTFGPHGEAHRAGSHAAAPRPRAKQASDGPGRPAILKADGAPPEGAGAPQRSERPGSDARSRAAPRVSGMATAAPVRQPRCSSCCRRSQCSGPWCSRARGAAWSRLRRLSGSPSHCASVPAGRGQCAGWASRVCSSVSSCSSGWRRCRRLRNGSPRGLVRRAPDAEVLARLGSRVRVLRRSQRARGPQLLRPLLRGAGARRILRLARGRSWPRSGTSSGWRDRGRTEGAPELARWARRWACPWSPSSPAALFLSRAYSVSLFLLVGSGDCTGRRALRNQRRAGKPTRSPILGLLAADRALVVVSVALTYVVVVSPVIEPSRLPRLRSGRRGVCTRWGKRWPALSRFEARSLWGAVGIVAGRPLLPRVVPPPRPSVGRTTTTTRTAS